jgi:hypothetical protein
MKHFSPDKDDPLFDAGYEYVESEVAKESQTITIGTAPLWYGWALRAAFWAGAKWERERSAEQRSVKGKAKS